MAIRNDAGVQSVCACHTSAVSGSALVMDIDDREDCVMNYNISQLLHYTTWAITDIIDLGKVWLPLNSLRLRPRPLLGQPDFPVVYIVGYCPRMSAITNTC